MNSVSHITQARGLRAAFADARPAATAEAVARLSALAQEALGKDGARCPACKGALANGELRSFAVGPAPHTVLSCAACGTRTMNPVPPPAELIHARWTPRLDASGYRAARAADALLRLAELWRAGVSPRGRMLVTGGGARTFAAAARLLGAEPAVLDAAAPPAQAGFASAVSLHSLERAADPEGEVASLASLLAPGAPLVIAAANAEGSAYRGGQLAWQLSQPPILRLHHFSERGLTALLRRQGLEVRRILLRERWDQNRIAEGLLHPAFSKLETLAERRLGHLPLALAASAARFAALAAAEALARATPAGELSELVLIAYRSDS